MTTPGPLGADHVACAKGKAVCPMRKVSPLPNTTAQTLKQQRTLSLVIWLLARQHGSMTQSDLTPRRWHDMGGQPAGKIDFDQHDFALWEKRVDALCILATERGLFTVDGLRRALEDMGEEAFQTMSYYERWIAAVNQNLIENGTYSLEELGHKMEAVARRGATYGEVQDD